MCATLYYRQRLSTLRASAGCVLVAAKERACLLAAGGACWRRALLPYAFWRLTPASPRRYAQPSFRFWQEGWAAVGLWHAGQPAGAPLRPTPEDEGLCGGWALGRGGLWGLVLYCWCWSLGQPTGRQAGGAGWAGPGAGRRRRKKPGRSVRLVHLAQLTSRKLQPAGRGLMNIVRVRY